MLLTSVSNADFFLFQVQNLFTLKMEIKSKKVMLCKGVEVKERTFENNRKNVIKLKMYRIMVEVVLTINDFI